MALPAAVQKQIDEANSIAAQVYAPVTEPPVPAAPAAPEAAAPLPQAEWEQRYKVLQGKYNAEVPRLQAQLRDVNAAQQNLQSQLTGTQTLLASLSAAPRAPTGASDGIQTNSVRRLVKDEEIKEYGADLVDLIGRAARDAVMPEVDSRLRPVVQQVERTAKTTNDIAVTTAATEEQKVLAALSTQVPNWMQLNEDQNFLAWLDQTDPYAGERRGELLNRAYQRHDSPRVVAFFKGFLNENATVTPPPSATPNSGIPSKTLDQLVAPGTQKAGTVDSAQDGAKRIWTSAEIAQFYKDVAGSKYARNQDRRKELETDIFAAQREGRIRR